MKPSTQITYMLRNALNGGVPYIHYKYEHFDLNNSQYSGSDYNSQIEKNYKSAKTQAKRRMTSMYTTLGASSDSQKTELMNTLYSILAMSEKPGVVEDLVGSDIKNKASEMIASIKKDINPVALKGGVKYAIVKEENLNWLNSLISSINSLDSNLKKVDLDVLEAFYGDKSKPEKLIINDELRLIHYDKTATTSLKNLNSELEEINKLAQGKGGLTSTPKKINYKGKEVDFTKILGAIGQQTLNIQGAILEGVTYASIQKAINEDLLKPFLKPGQKLEATKMGGSSNKSDVALTVTEDGKDGYKSVLSIGVSSKSTTVKKGSKTVFQTSSWESIFKKAQLLNSVEEYKLLNYFVHGKTRMGEAIALRKYVASKDIARVIMGEGDDTVYFIQTLTSLTTVEDLFDELIKTKNYVGLIPEKGGKSFSSAQDANKVYASTEYARSRIVLDLIRKVSLQYTFSHT